MICNKCGFNNQEGSIFCEKCGEKLNRDSIFCQNCGASLEGDEEFCPFCGKSLAFDDEACQKIKNTKKSTNYKAIIITGCIVLGVCILAFIIWNCINDDGQIKEYDQPQTEIEEKNKHNGDDSTTEQTDEITDNNYSQNDNRYITYADGYCHTFYFDTNGGASSFDTIEAYEGEEFAIPSYIPEKEGFSFVGWQVKRLADNKYYYTSTYNWMDINEGSAQGYSPSLYNPNQIILVDDSWKKGNVNNSNYVFIAVWR